MCCPHRPNRAIRCELLLRGTLSLAALFLATSLGLPLLSTAANLTWTNGPGFRAASVSPTGPGPAGFRSLPATSTGLTFTNVLPVTRHYTNQIYLNGSGVAAGDIDRDGWCDLVFGGLGGGSAIYRNLGNDRWQNVTANCGVDLKHLDVTGVVTADLDGDGDLDLILNTVGQGTHLLENQGTGRFVESPTAGVVNPGLCGSSSALADIDGDGLLDLYVANYRGITARDEPHLSFTINQEQGRPKVTAYGGRPISDPSLVHRFKFSYRPTSDGGATVFHDEQGEPDAVFHNDGRGRWSRMSWTNGAFLDETGAPLTQPPFDWGLSAMFRDLNGDQAPDLYVCNDFATPDRIWLNDGRGRFRALAASAVRQISLSSMAVDVADIDRDGFDDIFTADMLSPDRWRRLVQINQANPNIHLFADTTIRPQSPRNMLQHNRGDGTYEEVARMAGLEASEWSWASIFLDVDLDGFEDLLVANGFERDFMNMDAHRRVRAAQARLPRNTPPGPRLAANRLYPRLTTPNLAFRNLGDLRFVEVGHEWGFDVAEVSQGMCLADFDNDGDSDVAINNLNGPATILRNETVAPRLAVRLRGNPPNTRGIGARIEVRGGALPRQSQEIMAGGRYLSGDNAERVFAAGSLTNRLTVEVRWRSGKRSIVPNLLPNQICEIAESESSATPESPRRSATPSRLFEDASVRLGNHRHEPPAIDDFASQPMRPIRLSALGPGVAWIDLDHDGWDDLVLPGGMAEPLTTFRGDGRGGFVRQKRASVEAPAGSTSPAHAGIVGWCEADGRGLVLAGEVRDAGNETTNSPAIRRYTIAAFGELLPSPVANGTDSIGPVAVADVDGDGDLDLFAGGRFRPRRWPEPASSVLYLRRPDGQWRPDDLNSIVFNRVGLVSGALFTDIDADGDPDLVLAREWGALRIYRNDRGRFTFVDWKINFVADPTEARGLTNLNQLTGWWTGVNAGDFDGDGRMDLVAGNWGRNTTYERLREQPGQPPRPIRIYFGDFAGDESLALLECGFDAGLGKYAPLRDVWTLSKSMPWLLARFDGYEKFARASVEEALGEHFARAQFVEAAWADSTVFLNRGDHFEVRPLPRAAQVAPVFAVCVADFDGDARDDLFLSQNFFAVRPDASRLDAGHGLVLRGDGRGGFAPLTSTESGVLIEGEQRGAAIADFDHDGRADLVVAQFDGPTRLFRNLAGRPGVRVRLNSSAGNPPAIGSIIRFGTGGNWGPAREVHAGSGYWSQDSAAPIVSGPVGANRLQIRWPDGRTTEMPVGAGAIEVNATQP